MHSVTLYIYFRLADLKDPNSAEKIHISFRGRKISSGPSSKLTNPKRIKNRNLNSRMHRRAFGVINPRSIGGGRRRKQHHHRHHHHRFGGKSRKHGARRYGKKKVAKNSFEQSVEKQAQNQAFRGKARLRSSNEIAKSGSGACEETEDDCETEMNVNERYNK